MPYHKTIWILNVCNILNGPYLENRGIFRVIWEAWQSIFRIDIRHRFLHSNIVRICACHLLVRCTPWQWPGPLFPPPDAKNRWQCEARDLDTQCRHCCRKLLLCNSHWCSRNPALRGILITVFGCDQLQEEKIFKKLGIVQNSFFCILATSSF